MSAFDLSNLVKVEDLRVGDLVDLEYDMYADPGCNDEAFAYAFQRVAREPAHEVGLHGEPGIEVYFDDVTVVFPVGHEVHVEGEDMGA